MPLTVNFLSLSSLYLFQGEPKINIQKINLPFTINPLRPNSDLSQTSHCNIKGLSVREVMRIENMIPQVKFYWYLNSFSQLLI